MVKYKGSVQTGGCIAEKVVVMIPFWLVGSWNQLELQSCSSSDAKSKPQLSEPKAKILALG